MNFDDQDGKVIDITNYRSTKKENPDHQFNKSFIRYKREIDQTKRRISFLYSIINFLLVFNIFLTLSLFYFAVLK